MEWSGGFMALTQCNECGHEVSDKAATCPKCGNPIARTHNPKETGERVVTVQATAKSIKTQQLLATILCCVGIVLIIAENSAGALLVVGGIGWFILTRFMAWWHHG
jgi:uncharacterized membrane protein YvbJ